MSHRENNVICNLVRIYVTGRKRLIVHLSRTTNIGGPTMPLGHRLGNTLSDKANNTSPLEPRIVFQSQVTKTVYLEKFIIS